MKSEAKRGEGLGANRLGGLLRPRVRHGADYGRGTDTLELPRTVAGIERGLAATQKIARAFRHGGEQTQASIVGGAHADSLKETE